MAGMSKSYQPKGIGIGSASAAKTAVPFIKGSAQLAKWPLLFLGGIAKNTAGTAIANGAVLVWMTAATAGSVTDADFMTFTDTNGRYGLSISAGSKFVVKFYS